MKIGIIAGLAEGQKSGIGSYALNLVEELRKIDCHNEYFLILRKELKHVSVDSNHQIILPLPQPFRGMKGNFLLWQFFLLPLKLQKYDLDLIHDPYDLGFFALFNVPYKKVITIHDVAPIVNPKMWGHISVGLHKLLLPNVLKKVDRIITVSNFTKNEIVNHLKVNPNKISVTYQGINERFRIIPKHKLPPVLSKYKISQDFILYVGVLHKQKNIHSLIRAYAQVKNRIEHKLVIVGQKTFEGDNTIFSLVKNLGLQKDVMFTGYVPDEDLVALFNAASLFVYPSFYEGFGLPPLEAMACGTPVITSNRASLPEVVSDAALTIDPHNVDSLAVAIHNLITDNSLKQEMVQRGLERVNLFSRQEAAKRTLEVYNELLKHTRKV